MTTPNPAELRPGSRITPLGHSPSRDEIPAQAARVTTTTITDSDPDRVGVTPEQVLRPVGADMRSAQAQSASGSAVWYAQCEVLGVLLRDPDLLDHVAPWLHAHDFSDPQHRDVFAALAELRSAGGLVTPDPQQGIVHNVLAVRDALSSGRFPASADAAHDLVLDLVEASAGVTETQLAANGHKIVQMSARRQIESWGVALEHAAGPEMTVSNDASALHQTYNAIINNLADVDVQVRRSTGDVISRLAEPAGPVPVVPALTTFPHALVDQSERRLIHAVLSDDPAWRDSGVLHRFRPEDFVANPAHAETWRVMQALAANGQPINPVEVAWQAESMPHAASLAADQLMSMRQKPTFDVARAVSIVARSAIHHHAAEANRQLHVVAADRATSVDQVITAAHDTATDLVSQARRLLNAAHRPASALTRKLAGESPAAASPPPPPAHTTRSRGR